MRQENLMVSWKDDFVCWASVVFSGNLPVPVFSPPQIQKRSAHVCSVRTVRISLIFMISFYFYVFTYTCRFWRSLFCLTSDFEISFARQEIGEEDSK
ncbi:unnamed protein product [Brassica napus]|uniref:(rape) hypothetical protein n=1 Tax=Brassica napus TaxID=3708 RepID=A0A816TF26_BRANA|nr:unnamed protein product [Brassica napus]